jgi:hypothetical protein
MKSDVAIMYAVETIKSGLEHLTGIAQPTARELRKRIKKRKPRATVFIDNNHIPNNPTLPFIHYCNVISLIGALDPAAVLERVFKANGWIGSMSAFGGKADMAFCGISLSRSLLGVKRT